ncbi:MAG: PP2C family protein-serine/threonine phosphatase [Anaerolineales bacterium]|nr:PP2C family protein-serine/threonine phosphatase [Anaerolineales bacterium]
MSGWTGWLATAPTLSTARYHQPEIEQILQCVEDGVYCAVLGPRLCGKTELLRYIEQILFEREGWTCVYIDLGDMRSTNLQGFFNELIRLTTTRLGELTGVWMTQPDEGEASSAVFRAFLLDIAGALGQDLVLIIEHLEALPTDLVQALLTSLRAAYMDQQTLDQRVTVVVSGALSLASLTVGESSPFRGIARRVFVRDLSHEDSLSLICAILEDLGVELTPLAQERLLTAASGDPYLIFRLARRSAELVRSTANLRLRAANIGRITREFLRDEVYQYAPLLEAAHLIEEDPDLVRCILLLLEHESVARSELPLPLSPDLDPLYLTGVVDQVSEHAYRLQNEIYRQFLQRYFSPGRVGHMLAMTGRWDQAIDQLELAVHQGDRQSHSELLPAIINSIYAAQDIRQAAHFITRGLSAAFDVREARVWYAPPQENRLRLVGEWGSPVDESQWANPEMLLGADRLEARAYRYGQVMRGPESGGLAMRAIPLVVPGRSPVGVVTVWSEWSDRRFIEQRERDLHLLGFLRQAARALYSVGMRRQELILAGRLQASLLPESAPLLPGWQLAAFWRPARETSGDFYDFIPLPDGKLGLVIADVVDKGMGAALFMALGRTLMRTFAGESPDHPERVLLAVNQRMLSDAEAGHFVTLFYGILDVQNNRLLYCNAGHNPPYFLKHIDGGAGAPQMLSKTGPALGVFVDGAWYRAELRFEPGDLLLLYTDGVLDALNHHRQSFGDARMLEAVQRLVNPSAQDVQDALISSVRAFTGDEPQYDDITLMTVLRQR